MKEEIKIQLAAILIIVVAASFLMNIQTNMKPKTTPLVEDLRSASLSPQDPQIRAIVEIGEPAIEPLIETLKTDDPDIRLKAALTLSEIGEPAIEPLIEALKDDDLNVRSGAASALIEIGEPATEPLKKALSESSDQASGTFISKIINTIREGGTAG